VLVTLAAELMPATPINSSVRPDDVGKVAAIEEVHRQEALLKAGALQDAIFNSANFSSIATDEKGVIQLFNVGAERMLGYTADEVLNKVTPADISDPQKVIARAKALSVELTTTITPGFEAWSSRRRAGSRTSTSSPTSARMGAAFRPSCRSPRCGTIRAPSSATC
jgi:PAS domain S-box-containing protein